MQLVVVAGNIIMIMFIHRRGFTVIELIVAASIIGILAAIITTNLSESRAKARDANRSESVRAYSASMEQWKASNGTYFVYSKAGGGTLPSCNFLQGNGFMTCTGGSAVGFQGSGSGGITRKMLNPGDTVPAGYTLTSIADALQNAGYLSQVRLDPSDTNFNTNTDSSSSYSDFILTLCKADSSPADTPNNAQEYAIYTQLERPDSNSQAIADTHCGGPQTPSGGWDITVAR